MLLLSQIHTIQIYTHSRNISNGIAEKSYFVEPWEKGIYFRQTWWNLIAKNLLLFFLYYRQGSIKAREKSKNDLERLSHCELYLTEPGLCFVERCWNFKQYDYINFLKNSLEKFICSLTVYKLFLEFENQ